MKQGICGRLVAFASVSVVASVAATAGWAQQLTWLGTLGGNWTHAYGVSADGSVVVGSGINADGQRRAFRWTQSGGIQDLGVLPDYSNIVDAEGVSADGSVVVGTAYSATARAGNGAPFAGRNRAVCKTSARWAAT